jgi:hypothetical protein
LKLATLSSFLFFFFAWCAAAVHSSSSNIRDCSHSP